MKNRVHKAKLIRAFVMKRVKAAKAEVKAAGRDADGVRWNTIDGREALRCLALAEGKLAAFQALEVQLDALKVPQQ